MPRLQAAERLAAIVTLSAFPGAAAALEFNRGVERPPEIYRAGATQTGRTHEIDFTDPRAVDYLCRLALGEAPHRGAWWGCYRPDLDAVIVPARGSWREAERRQIVEHEWAHARGWRHNPDGRGTASISLPPHAFAVAGPAPAAK